MTLLNMSFSSFLFYFISGSHQTSQGWDYGILLCLCAMNSCRGCLVLSLQNTDDGFFLFKLDTYLLCISMFFIWCHKRILTILHLLNESSGFRF